MSTREENDKQREDKMKENGGKTNMEVKVHKQEQKKDDEIEKVEFSLGSNSHIAQSKRPSDASDDEPSERSWTRYAILSCSIICLSSLMANIVCFNFTVLCMPATYESLSLNHTQYTGYNKNDRTLLFSAVAVGALFAVVPVSLLISKYGSRKVFFMSGMISSFATAAIPFVSPYSLNMFLALRFIQGIAFASCLPTVGAVTASWASLRQHGLFMACLTTFGQLSSVFSMPVSGELCTSSLGWESVYYLHAIICFITFIGWVFLYTDLPEYHPMVSKTELLEITAGKSLEATSKDAQSIPYLKILLTPSIWGVWIGGLGDFVAVNLIHTFSPLYIRTILQYSVHHTGFAAALPVLIQFIVKIFAGHSSDSIRSVSETTKLRLYNTLALGASGAFLCACAFVQRGQGTLGLTLITLATAMFGFNGGGFNKVKSYDTVGNIVNHRF
ncbi:hypothetical protein WR25_21911 [Diploscapter pachys]|uniref:Major facilitator superfamily (MFS) profile domain-containing protein n=1 Tax=Diploscapter pachys TaxID=2018661 RepID=A0A2A2LYR7_9BILA|nr:hypothetical protein WR25_21911 [Diploscapter pachys]